MSPGKPADIRFWALVDIGTENECWPWLGKLNDAGYGMFWASLEEPYKRAHRFSYEDKVGPIPDGHHLDHLCHTEDSICPGGRKCRHRHCVNPTHLEAVEPAENGRRAGIRVRPLLEARREKVVQLTEEGRSRAQIASALSITEDRVTADRAAHRRTHGLPTRRSLEAKRDEKILGLWEAGLSTTEISNRLGYSNFRCVNLRLAMMRKSGRDVELPSERKARRGTSESRTDRLPFSGRRGC